jgi:UDP-3-O-[3-hydroxymyristoyl] glucosamine N-acyltransferase
VKTDNFYLWRMEFTARQIAEIIGGEITGNPEVKVNGLSKIEEGMSNTLSFLANPKYTQFIYSTKASVVIVSNSFEAEQALPETCTLIKVENAYESFAKLLELYNQIQHSKTGIEAGSFIHPSAKIGDRVYISAGAYIAENARIGNDTKIYANTFIGSGASVGEGCLLFPNVVIYNDCKLGNHCRIHAGVIIGGDGFGFAPNQNNEYKKVAQIGNVIIEDWVEIGAGTTIDRATLGSTIIRKGVKLDNLIQIAHNVEIGENTVIAAQTGVAGSTKIGNNCMIGGQVGIVGHINIGNNVKIAAQSGIGSSIPDGEVVQGSPAFAIGDFKRAYVAFKNLPDLQQRLNQLEKELESLKKNTTHE